MKQTTSKRSRFKRNLSKVSLALVISIFISLIASNLHAATNQPAKVTQSVIAVSPNQQKPNFTENNLYEFTYTLALAKKLGFGKIVNLIEEEDYKKALTTLDTKTASNFKWNLEAMPGYQYGFFAEALKGICLEKSGEVVKAYRAYQNARYYCDEEKVLQMPAQKLELWCGIGRMCNKADRYYDALSYLENARIEAAEYPTVVIAADRGLIERAVEIGDYEESIWLYEDISTKMPLLKEDLSNYADCLFILKKNRDAFNIIFMGIDQYGFDAKLGVNDSFWKLIKKNFVKITDQELQQLYDLMGIFLSQVKCEKSSEKFVQLILDYRFYFSKYFSFIKAEDDLELICDRINDYKNNSTANMLVSAKTHSLNFKRKKVKKVKSNKNSKDSTSNYDTMEDQLMQADCILKHRGYSKAKAIYDNVVSNLPANFVNIPYDDTSYLEAAKIGQVHCALKLNQPVNNKLEISPYSLRGNLLGILLYYKTFIKSGDETYQEFYFQPSTVKFSHPIYSDRKIQISIIRKKGSKGEFLKIQKFMNQLVEANPFRNQFLGRFRYFLLLYFGEYEASVKASVEYLEYFENRNGDELYEYANQKDIKKYFRTWKLRNLMKQRVPKENDLESLFKNRQLLYDNLDKKKYDEALNWYRKLIRDYHTYQFGWIPSYIYAKKGEFREANLYLKGIVNSNNSDLKSLFSNNSINYKLTKKELEIIGMIFEHLNSEERQWIENYK